MSQAREDERMSLTTLTAPSPCTENDDTVPPPEANPASKAPETYFYRRGRCSDHDEADQISCRPKYTGKHHGMTPLAQQTPQHAPDSQHR